MESTNLVPDQQQVLEAADRVARAAHLWIRHGNTIQLPSEGPGAREDLIAGIIFGLCNALELDERHALLSAYVYALIDGDAAEALLVAQSMFRRRAELCGDTVYQQGLQAATDLIALIEWPVPGAAANRQAFPI